MNGYKIMWKKRKAVQALNYAFAQNRIKSGLEVNDEKLLDLYRRKLLSKTQIESLKRLRLLQSSVKLR